MKMILFSKTFNVFLLFIIAILSVSKSVFPQPILPPLAGKDQVNQGDSLDKNKLDHPSVFLGLGGTITIPGGALELEFTILSRSMWGGSLNYKTTFFKSEDMPAGYLEERLFKIIPKDYLDIVSFCLVKSVRKGEMGIGFEAGPAFVSFNEAVYTISPFYDPDYNPSLLNKKWEMDHHRRDAFGFTLCGKIEIIPSNVVGIKLFLFTDINNIHSQVGLGCSILFGYFAR
jgi:hypothetical protein